MITWTVVADDLSGAAELGAAARRFGLRVSLTRGTPPAADADVWVLDTGTRDLPRPEARQRFTKLTGAVAGRVFKKVDSVLRGHAGLESELLAEMLGRRSLRVVPGNPARGRTVQRGELQVAGLPLAETIFRDDPLYPATTSQVTELWQRSGATGRVPAELPAEVTGATLPALADCPPDCLPVGAVEFFAACLQCEYAARPPATPELPVSGGVWVVCGSRASWPAREEYFRQHGWLVQTLTGGGPVLLGCGREPLPDSNAAVRQLADRVKVLATTNAPSLWCLEGGATAAAVLDAMGWTECEVLGEVAPGTACLQPVGTTCRVCVKPGSYDWPAPVLAAWAEAGRPVQRQTSSSLHGAPRTSIP